MNQPTITSFGLQSTTDRTMYAVWEWIKDHTKEYRTIWYYDTGDNVWFIGNDSTTTDKQSVYTAPNNAKRVKFKVKPISDTYKSNDQDVNYWTASYSTSKEYNFSDNPPEKPEAPEVNVTKYKLTAYLENISLNADEIEFVVYKNNSSKYESGIAKIVANYASYTCTVGPGNIYRVKCRSKRDGMNSEWSEWSSEVSAIPSTPTAIHTIRATSETSVYLEWDLVSSADSYEIEYTTKKEYFDGSDQTQTVSNITSTHYEKTGLETGQEYFFRVRAVNNQGESAWSGIKSVTIGKKPSPPTTWSSTTTAIIGDTLNLYWVHNSEDGSSQTEAIIQLYYSDGASKQLTIKNSTEDDLKDKTSVYSIDTSDFIEGTSIQWRVKTRGVTSEWSEWSVQRTVDIYAPPTLQLNVTDIDGNDLETLTTFPFYISAIAEPDTQIPIGYSVKVIANEAYETVDNTGVIKYVNKGDEVYSKIFDTNEQLLIEMSASNIDLENNISYTVVCSVSMNSGLSAESSDTFTVGWTDEEYAPNAEITINQENLSANIMPYCKSHLGSLIEGVLLSVYRREFNGDFTELATNLENTKKTFITDPHPSLDFARYRIVAKTIATGAISYYDVPGYPVNGKAIIIQWDEVWSSYSTYNEDLFEEQPWTGSMLRLPYNIDVSDSNQSDVSLIEYIGRSYPVSYYGTQLGMTSTWNVLIPKDDKDTLYGLRRLANWMGDVYVREPSGSGYWANISVSFSQKHRDVTIPVTLNITRVSGGA